MSGKTFQDFLPATESQDPTDLYLNQRGGAYIVKNPSTVADLTTGTNPGSVVEAGTFNAWLSNGLPLADYIGQAMAIPALANNTPPNLAIYDQLEYQNPVANAIYVVQVTALWAYDGTTTDFQSELQSNHSGTFVNVLPVGHRVEPKEAGGNGFGGTDQSPSLSMKFEVQIPAVAPASFSIRYVFGSSSLAVNATVYCSYLEIYKKP